MGAAMPRLTITIPESDITETTELDRLLASWTRHLRGSKQPTTIRAYSYAVRGVGYRLDPDPR